MKIPFVELQRLYLAGLAGERGLPHQSWCTARPGNIISEGVAAKVSGPLASDAGSHADILSLRLHSHPGPLCKAVAQGFSRHLY